MIKNIFITALISILLIGCIAPRPLNTSSGKPDVTIPKVNKKQVTDALVSEMMTRGFTIKTSSDYNIVFTKLLDNMTASLLFGSRYDSNPEHRASFMLVESSAGVRIVLTNQIITNPGSAYERATDASTGEAGTSWQAFLESFANIFKGRIGIQMADNGVITDITNGSPAEESKLQKGDKIISVNGYLFTRSSPIAGDPGTIVELEILRNNHKLIFKITRRLLQ